MASVSSVLISFPLYVMMASQMTGCISVVALVGGGMGCVNHIDLFFLSKLRN